MKPRPKSGIHSSPPGHSPREREIIERAKANLLSLVRWPSHGYLFKTTGGKEPDLVGALNGRAVVCEGKQLGERPTRAQLIRLQQWSLAGAFALWTEDGFIFHRVHGDRTETAYSTDELKQERESIFDGRI